MGKRVLKSVLVELGGVDRSTWFENLQLVNQAGEVVVTTFGDDAVRREASILDGSLTLGGIHDDADAVAAWLFANTGTKVTFKVRANADAVVSSTNRDYEGTVVVLGGALLNGSVGDKSTFTLNLPCDGAITEATSA